MRYTTTHALEVVAEWAADVSRSAADVYAAEFLAESLLELDHIRAIESRGWTLDVDQCPTGWEASIYRDGVCHRARHKILAVALGQLEAAIG